MKELNITLPPALKRAYPIYIGSNLIEQIATLIDFKAYSNIFIITDKTVEQLLLQKLQQQLPKVANFLALPPGESAKDISQLTEIWKAMIAAQLDRKSLVINLGGGVIGDIGGFAAATYMRGIPFINISTTLLAQVDESVGGKTMIDFAGIKNIVGTFYQPTAVIIDVTTLQTLPKRELLAGWAEIIKHGLIQDNEYFETVTSKDPLSFSEAELIDIIARSCEIKSAIVQSDETEIGKRKLVNLGHTIGHAVEALSLETDAPLLHGEAVSIGIVAEAYLAQRVGLLSEEDALIIKTKLATAGLPTEIPDYPIDAILAKMKSDKKNVGGKINFTLLKRIGEALIDQTIPEELITTVLSKK